MLCIAAVLPDVTDAFGLFQHSRMATSQNYYCPENILTTLLAHMNILQFTYPMEFLRNYFRLDVCFSLYCETRIKQISCRDAVIQTQHYLQQLDTPDLIFIERYHCHLPITSHGYNLSD